MRNASVEQMWERFYADRDKKSRDYLVLHYYFLVKRIAKKMAATMPVSAKDLESDGTFGLIDAIEKYDKDKGVKFEVYAVTRIRGSMIDAIRSRDHVPRSFRFKESKIEYAIEYLSQKLGHEPSIDEIADFTQLKHDEISDTYRVCDPILFDFSTVDYEGAGGWDSQHVDKTTDGPGESADMDALREMLASSFNELKEREKVLFVLYYNEGLPLSDIGTIFGITEARASQIHIKAIRDLYSKVLP